MAYTYLIGWTDLNKYYYGMRSANKVSPVDDLWHIYKTSSVYVHEFVAQFGEPDVIRVHKEFETKDEAYLFETKFLRRTKAHINDKWLNQNIMGKPLGGTPAQLASVKGVAQSEDHKIKRGIYKPKSAETKAKMSKAHSGEGNPMHGRKGEKHPGYGKKRTPEQLENIRAGVKAAWARKKLTNNDRTSL